MSFPAPVYAPWRCTVHYYISVNTLLLADVARKLHTSRVVHPPKEHSERRLFSAPMRDCQVHVEPVGRASCSFEPMHSDHLQMKETIDDSGDSLFRKRVHRSPDGALKVFLAAREESSAEINYWLSSREDGEVSVEAEYRFLDPYAEIGREGLKDSQVRSIAIDGVPLHRYVECAANFCRTALREPGRGSQE